MSADWLETQVCPEDLNVRLNRGTLSGYLPNLVAFCLGPRPARAAALDHFRIIELWWIQRPGNLGLYISFGCVTVRERAFAVSINT